MELLTDRELEKLSDAGLFYDVSNTGYDFDFNSSAVLSGNNNDTSFDLKLYTSYEPLFDFLRDIYINYPAAGTSSNLIFASVNKSGRPLARDIPSSRTCIVLVHGFKSRNKKIYLQLAQRFARNGIDGIVYSLPFHFERRYLDDDGRDVLDMNDFRATLEFFRQTVIELRILVKVLKKIGYSSVGVLGFSFGGYCCNLLASFDSIVDFIVPMASMGDFGDLLIFKKEKADLDLKNEKDQVNDFFASNYLKLICPINYRPLIDKENILFVQGLFDGRAPYREVLKLKKKWGDPEVLWYPCDHATFFIFNRLTLVLTVRFIRKLGF